MEILWKPFRESFAKAWWLFLKERSAFFGANLAPLSIGIVAFLCGLTTALPHRMELSQQDLVRMLFHMFYIIILGSALFLSMSAFVSERRQGTLELLYTLPVSDVQLVLGKFFMGVFLMASLVFGMGFVYIFWLADAPWYMALAGALGLFLAGLYAYSVGIFASSFTDSHFLSLLISSLIIGFIDVGGYLAGLLDSPAKEIVTHLHGLHHFFTFTRGVIPLRGIIFFGTLILLFLFASVKVLESRRWRGERS